MAELFATSGESDDSIIAPPPQLQGIFIPGIDDSRAVDGFGIVVPFGGGSTTRKYADYGISAEVSRQATQLGDLSFAAPIGGGLTYGLEGERGLRGFRGERGLPGIISLLGLNLPPSFQQNTNFLVALPHNIDLINDLGTAADKLIYTNAYNTYTGIVWTERQPGSGVEKETFELSDGTGSSTYGTNWTMQSWTTTSAYTITAVALYCFKYGSPGDITVSIRAVDGDGKPTGEDLCSITVSDSVISAFPTRAWYTFTFETPYDALDDATQYAIVWRAPDGDAANYFCPFGYGSSGYAGGGLATSPNSGSSWSLVSTANDMDFRTYGVGINQYWFGGASDDDGSHLIGAVYTGRLYTSSNSGVDWTERQPAGDTNKNWRAVASDADGSHLIIGASAGRLYTSADGGVNWTERQPAGDVNKDWQAVASDSDGSHLIALILDGRLYTSANSGVNWTERQPAGNDDAYWRAVASDADGSHLIVGSSLTGRLYTSADGGANWTERQPAGDTDKNWRCVASDSDGSHLIAGISSGRLYTSSNYGVSWTERQPAGDGDISWRAAASDADGSHLMVGAYSGRLYVSTDSGVTWSEEQPAGDGNENWHVVGLDSDGSNAIVGVSNGGLYTGIETTLYSEATWAESALTSAGRALLDDANAAAQATTLGLGTGDSPTWAGATLTGLSGVLKASAGVIAGSATLDDISDGTSYERVAANQLDTGIYIDATTTTKGIASFSSTYFSVSSGVVSLIGGGGLNHSDLGNLGYASAGHTGFEPTVSKGNLTEDTSSVLTIGSGTGAVIGSGTTIQIGLATPSNGDTTHLSTADQIYDFIVAGYQPLDAILTVLSALGVPQYDSFIVGDGIGSYAHESGATARTSLGVDAAGTAAGLVGDHETTYNHGNYNTAYNNSVTAIAFNAADGIITLTQQDAGTLVTDSLDGRYFTETEITTNYQPLHANLTNLAGLTYAAASYVKMTGANTFVLRTIANVRTDLSITNVEDTAISTWAGSGNITTVGALASGSIAAGFTSISTTYTDAKCTDALADQTSANETSHADVVVDGDFGSNGILNRTGAGAYSILALGTDVQAYHANLAAIAGGTWTGAASITTLGTIATVGNITIADGGTIGQAAGPLLTFNDTNNRLVITGCRVGIGVSVPFTTLHLQEDGSGCYLTATAYRSAVYGGGFQFSHARGSLAAPVKLNNNDYTLFIEGRAHDGNDLAHANASIAFIVDGTINENDVPGRIIFSTTPSGSSTPTERLRIMADGGIKMLNLKSGTDQTDAGAATGELYSDTNDDNTVKIGV